MKTSLPQTLVVLSLAAVSFAACGGLADGPRGAGDSGGGDDDSDASADGGGACVTIDLSSYDVSCMQPSDCVVITAGTLCDGACTCGGATINGDGEARYQQAIASITQGDCFCPNTPAPLCLDGACTICTGGPNDPPACRVLSSDAGAPTCVDVDVTTYDQSCDRDSDCIEITAGEYCDNGCGCGGSTINASGQARYDQQTAGITPDGCPCPSLGVPRCVAHVCTMCGFGAPNAPAGCPDGG